VVSLSTHGSFMKWRGAREGALNHFRQMGAPVTDRWKLSGVSCPLGIVGMAYLAANRSSD
jgi:hypothetical protein